MTFLSRLFSSTTTIVTETHTLPDARGVPCPLLARSGAFEPDVLAVEYRNDRFHQMRVSGPAVGHPAVRVTRCFGRLRDVPQWARGYVSEERIP